MPSSSVPAATVTVLASLALLAGSAVATAAPPAPRIDRPSGAHVISTPAGKRLAVDVAVDYRTGLTASVPRATVVTKLRAVAVLRSGTRLTAPPDQRGLPGASRTRVEHHLFFSPRQTRTLTRARGVRLRLSAQATITPSGGAPVATATTSRDAALPAVTPAPASSGGYSHAKGTTPCTYYGYTAANCLNVGVGSWGAEFLWNWRDFHGACPSAFPSLSFDTTVDTKSDRYTETTYGDNTSGTFSIIIVDDNLHHHPWWYTPWYACLTANTPGAAPRHAPSSQAGAS